MIITYLLAFTLFILVSYFDFKYKIIPNSVSIGFLAAGLTIAGINGMSSLFTSLFASLVGFCILLLPYLLGAVGGGDVKFLAAIGALLGFHGLLQTVLIGFIVAGIASIIVLFRHGRYQAIKYLFYGIIVRGKLKDLPSSNLYIPLGPCISIGGIIYLITRIGWF
jgi:prepilin peptidase CpaA